MVTSPPLVMPRQSRPGGDRGRGPIGHTAITENQLQLLWRIALAMIARQNHRSRRSDEDTIPDKSNEGWLWEILP